MWQLHSQPDDGKQAYVIGIIRACPEGADCSPCVTRKPSLVTNAVVGSSAIGIREEGPCAPEHPVMEFTSVYKVSGRVRAFEARVLLPQALSGAIFEGVNIVHTITWLAKKRSTRHYWKSDLVYHTIKTNLKTDIKNSFQCWDETIKEGLL